MAYESWRYRDPLQILIEKQERSCHGCKHEERYTIAGKAMFICMKGRRHGRKCKLFKERD